MYPAVGLNDSLEDSEAKIMPPEKSPRNLAIQDIDPCYGGVDTSSAFV